MRRARLVAAVGFAAGLLVLALPVAPAAPVPKHLMPKEDPVCFPTKVGDRMVSVLNGSEIVCVVTKVEKLADGVAVTQEFEDDKGNRTPDMVVVASDKGLKIVEYAGRKLEPPAWWLKLPHVENNEWPDPLGGNKRRTLGWEEIEVPAGKFRAMRVERDDDPQGRSKTTYWYAPGLGCIKWSDAQRARELKAFAPGK